MKKTILSASVAALLAASAMTAMAEDAAPADPLTFNVGAVSNYIFRGISQTHGDAAVQGGVDYAFSNGFYVGAWGSNVSWVKNALGKGSVELDLYGGYKGAINEDWTYDVGAIAYTYPGHGKATTGGLGNPTTSEAYAALTWKWLTAKYSYTMSDKMVGWYGGRNLDQNSRGSDYIELNANYDLGDGWTAIGHIGRQKIANSVTTSGTTNPAGGVKSASYTDFKVGLTKDAGFGVFGVAYSATSVSGSCNADGTGTNPYCWGDNGSGDRNSIPSAGFANVAKGTATLSFTKTF